jgi:hypothetical protein
MEARCRQNLEVYERPGKPGPETAYLHLAAFAIIGPKAYRLLSKTRPGRLKRDERLITGRPFREDCRPIECLNR